MRDDGRLLHTVDRISRAGDVLLQRHLFARVEAAARRAVHSAVLDAWGEALDLMQFTVESAMKAARSRHSG